MLGTTRDKFTDPAVAGSLKVPRTLSTSGLTRAGYGGSFDMYRDKGFEMKLCRVVALQDTMVLEGTSRYTQELAFTSSYRCAGFRVIRFQMQGRVASGNDQPFMAFLWVGFGDDGPKLARDDTFVVQSDEFWDSYHGGDYCVGVEMVEKINNKPSIDHDLDTEPKALVDWGRQFHFGGIKEINRITIGITTYEEGIEQIPWAGGRQPAQVAT